MSERKTLWNGEFSSLFEDGQIGCSDGVGYVGEERDVRGLYEALKGYFEPEVAQLEKENKAAQKLLEEAKRMATSLVTRGYSVIQSTDHSGDIYVKEWLKRYEGWKR